MINFIENMRYDIEDLYASEVSNNFPIVKDMFIPTMYDEYDLFAFSDTREYKRTVQKYNLSNLIEDIPTVQKYYVKDYILENEDELKYEYIDEKYIFPIYHRLKDRGIIVDITPKIKDTLYDTLYSLLRDVTQQIIVSKTKNHNLNLDDFLQTHSKLLDTMNNLDLKKLSKDDELDDLIFQIDKEINLDNNLNIDISF